MCRYAETIYKPHYACFVCRKTFKRRLLKDINREATSDTLHVKCPQCAGPMADMGLDFESPKQTDVKAWKHISSLYTMGITFHSCGCTGPGYIPATKQEIICYFVRIKDRYEQELDFWRHRVAPKDQRERDREISKNRAALYAVNPDYHKEAISNEEGINYWLAKIKDIQTKIDQAAQLP